MSMFCWLSGHIFERTECWTGNAYNCLSVQVEYYKCSRCGKIERRVIVHGRLPREEAESLCTSENMIAGPFNDDFDSNELLDLALTVAKPKRKYTKKQSKTVPSAVTPAKVEVL